MKALAGFFSLLMHPPSYLVYAKPKGKCAYAISGLALSF